MTETVSTIPALSREEQAFLMKALWESLQVPSWNRDDLIDLGKLIFAKKSLKEIASQDEKKFTRLFPHLVAIVNHLGAKIMEATAAAQAQQAALATSQPPIPSHNPPSLAPSANAPSVPVAAQPTSPDPIPQQKTS
jgi:hypothetical protein